LKTKRIHRYIFTGLIVATIITGLTSCKSTKYMSYDKAKPIFFKKLINSIEQSYLDYHTLYIKFSADFATQEKEQSFNGTLKIKKDTLIWMSITPALGIEAFRMQLTPDSIMFMNRISKEYYTGSYDFISNTYDIELDFKNLQAILTNELFTYPNSGDIKDPKHTFNVATDSNLYILRTHKKRKIRKSIKKGKTDDFVTQTSQVLSEMFKVQSVFIREYGLNRNLQVNYSDFILVGDKKFPEKLSIEFASNNENTKLDLDLIKISVNSTNKFPWKVPEKYEELKSE